MIGNLTSSLWKMQIDLDWQWIFFMIFHFTLNTDHKRYSWNSTQLHSFRPMLKTLCWKILTHSFINVPNTVICFSFWKWKHLTPTNETVKTYSLLNNFWLYTARFYWTIKNLCCGYLLQTVRKDHFSYTVMIEGRPLEEGYVV